MRLTITTNQGEVIEVIEDLEQYNLDGAYARADLIDEIKRAQVIGRDMEAKELK